MVGGRLKHCFMNFKLQSSTHLLLFIKKYETTQITCVQLWNSLFFITGMQINCSTIVQTISFGHRPKH